MFSEWIDIVCLAALAFAILCGFDLLGLDAAEWPRAPSGSAPHGSSLVLEDALHAIEHLRPDLRQALDALRYLAHRVQGGISRMISHLEST